MKPEEQTRLDGMLAKITINPPRNPDELPGLMKYKIFSTPELAINAVIFVLTLVAVGGMFVYIGPNSIKSAVMNMIQTEAMVTETREWSSGHKQVKYKFMAQGAKAHFGEDEVNINSSYHPVVAGDSIQIVYASQDPFINGVGQSMDKVGLSPIVIVLIIFMMGVFPAMHIPAFLHRRKIRNIFINGLITDAEVIFIKTDVEFATTITQSGKLVYKYIDKNGGQIEATCKIYNTWMMNKFEIGSKVKVVYLEQSPSESFVLECYIR